MINLDRSMKEFIKYSKNFDLGNSHNMSDFHHAFRVMEYAKDISRSLKLSKEDVKLACLCGLLHDIGHYQQRTKYGTNNDSISVDHGTLGSDILLRNNYISKYTRNKKEQDIILTSIKNHNKYSIELGLGEKELMFARITRDADKLDIIKEQDMELKATIERMNPNLINEVLNNQLCAHKYIVYPQDKIMREIGFIYDIYYPYTFKFLIENNVIMDKIDLLETHLKDVSQVEKVKYHVQEYMEGKSK